MLTMAFMCLSAPDVRLHGICLLSHSLQTTRVLSKQMHKVPVFWGFVVSKQISPSTNYKLSIKYPKFVILVRF